jgi:hypothetical protein
LTNDGQFQGTRQVGHDTLDRRKLDNGVRIVEQSSPARDFAKSANALGKPNLHSSAVATLQFLCCEASVPEADPVEVFKPRTGEKLGRRLQLVHTLQDLVQKVS